MLTASSKGINLIIANDPDADRFAAAESIKNSDEGSTSTSSSYLFYFVLYCSKLFHLISFEVHSTYINHAFKNENRDVFCLSLVMRGEESIYTRLPFTFYLLKIKLSHIKYISHLC